MEQGVPEALTEDLEARKPCPARAIASIRVKFCVLPVLLAMVLCFTVGVAVGYFSFTVRDEKATEQYQNHSMSLVPVRESPNKVNCTESDVAARSITASQIPVKYLPVSEDPVSLLQEMRECTEYETFECLQGLKKRVGFRVELQILRNGTWHKWSGHGNGKKSAKKDAAYSAVVDLYGGIEGVEAGEIERKGIHDLLPNTSIECFPVSNDTTAKI